MRSLSVEQKIFSPLKARKLELPDLSELQLRSYKWFFENGLKELLNEVSPIKDYTGKELMLEFMDYSLDEPKYSEEYVKNRNLSYEAALRVKLRLTNKRIGEIKEQEVYLGDFPLMTPRGTFIVNGVERVVVSQLIRSSGVYFTAYATRGKKYFGAKIIPNRGAWLEFETDMEGVISVKLDRKRKIPVTAIMRIFGAYANEDIQKLFDDVDTGEIRYIKTTLEHDPASNQDEAFTELYKRIRPGDLATVDNARALIMNMFSEERYDLADVGRYKFNQRLFGNKKRTNKVIDLEDVVAVVREIILLNNRGDAAEDDIDHLGNRRIRGVGELLQGRLRIGIARMMRIIKDRMSTFDVYTLTPSQLINARPFTAALKEFFTSSQLSQFMDQKNPLAELEHRRRLSAMGPGGLTRERAGFEVRDVHTSHYGRICPIHTPEGQNIGLVGHMASYARLNELGLIETPYIKVKNGLVTNEIEYLDASAEAAFNIAHAGIKVENDIIMDENVEARIHGQPGIIEREKIHYIDVSPQQSISIATSLIPFLENDDANRALMGSNMQKQAVPCVRSEAPLVGTGTESAAARDSGRVILAEDDGEITEVDAKHITIKNSKTSKIQEYKLISFVRTNNFTSIRQKPIVVPGQKVKKGEVIADSSAIDNGRLALGQNVLAAFISWSGSNYEDAIIISERLVKDERFTSVHIEDYAIDVRDTKLGPEITSPDIPNIGEEKLKNLDEDGIVRIGAEVRSGDILVGKISPKGETDLTPEERLLRAIFGEKARDVKDTSMTMPHGKRGRVISVQVLEREKGDKLDAGVIKRVQVEVAQLRRVAVGDKLAGRHGNKGIISKILPEEDMPYLADGRPVDIILNPLGVVSRMNLGQILETHLGLAAKTLGYQAISPSLAGADEEEIRAELVKAGYPADGKVMLYDGRSGKQFSQKVTVGYTYIMKLDHLVEDKIHMRSIGPYSLITQQPLGGKAQFGGQRFGEMEVWALEGYGAAHVLQEMLTIKSDDVSGRAATYEAIINGEKIKAPNIPASFNVLTSELRGLGINVIMHEKEIALPEAQTSKELSAKVVAEEIISNKA